jgi:hypothetical protein
MPLFTRCLLPCALALALATPMAHAASFVYEGRLDDLGQPANGRYDLKLSAYGDAALGATLAAPITFEGVEVREGRFRLDVALPLVQADQVWLEVAVRGSGEPAFSVIPGRSKAIAAPLIGACWSTTGDSGVNPATNFIGTTDNQPLVLRVNNQQALRIEPNSLSPNLIAGSSGNTVTAGVVGATISGGGNFSNRVTDDFGTIGGGGGNLAGDNAGTTSDRTFATVGGGSFNSARGGGSTVGGGNQNSAEGSTATIAGGDINKTRADRAFVGGGLRNEVFGSFGSVTGGLDNCAGGRLSWAGGNQAKVRPGAEPAFPTSLSCDGLGTYPGGEGDAGTFVWADSQTADFISTGSNQFLVRAQGGAAINSNNPLGNALRVNGTLRVDTLGTAAATTLCRNANNQISGCSSSARYKQDIDDLALGLDTALRLHAVGYRWKASLEADIGFVAEEIAVIDERLVTRNGKGEIEGVKYDRLTAVLANAVQELAAQGSLAAETVARVSAENAELRAELDRRDVEYRTRLERLEALLGERVGGAR